MLGNFAGLDGGSISPAGEGHYARMLRRQGAVLVIGVDISEGMIPLVREEEGREPLGVEYVKAAVEDLGVVGAFDVVSAVYLLHYAPTREHLAAMCRTHRREPPAGRAARRHEQQLRAWRPGRHVAVRLEAVGSEADRRRHGVPAYLPAGTRLVRDPELLLLRTPLTKKSSARPASSRCSGIRRSSPRRPCSSTARITGRTSSNWRRSSASSAAAECGRPRLLPGGSDNGRLNRAGRYDRLANSVERVTGRPAMSVREFVSLHADEFGGRRS